MSGLEQRYLEFLFFAYSGVWVIMGGFLVRMVRRAKHLEDELKELKAVDSVDSAASEASAEAPWSGPSV
ncbi:MAG: CcmD family protein [Firmicutes bacterium]|nr:CcmD family protein [Bacillota bacterium]